MWRDATVRRILAQWRECLEDPTTLNDGFLTGVQARALRAGDRAIARQDHADARANGGYITRAQQRHFNAQENAQSRAIGH